MASLPPISAWWAGFIFLVPLLGALRGRGAAAAFVLFFAFAFLSRMLLLYWIPRVMVRYGGASPLLGVTGLVALCLFLALFCGLAGVLIRKSLSRPLLSLLLVPAAWVTHDLAVERVFSGFPWCLAGYSQHGNLPLVQWAAVGGVHLLTFLLLFFNIAISQARRRRRLQGALLFAALFLHAGGLLMMRDARARQQELPAGRAGIIQPNVNHDIRFTSSTIESGLSELLAHSQALATGGARFVVWPEFTLPIYPLQSPRYHKRIQAVAAASGAPILAGFTDLQGSDRVFNAAMLFDGDTVQTYNKVHLTPFGEYIPFRRLLFFVRRITDEIGDFTPGESLRPMTVSGHGLATPICYEVIYPALVRRLVVAGGEAIVTLSNDSWFGDTSAPYQHLAMAAMRAVENRRWLLRSTSNGLSAVVDPAGRVRRRVAYGKAEKILADFRYQRRLSLFSRGGYLFPWLCLGITAAWLLLALWRLPAAQRRHS